jgi:hypothetical protein
MLENENLNEPQAQQFNIGAVMPRFSDIDYNIGDVLVSKENPNKEIGVCTGFMHNDTCVDINGKCWGGRTYFMKSEWTDCVILNDA